MKSSLFLATSFGFLLSVCITTPAFSETRILVKTHKNITGSQPLFGMPVWRVLRVSDQGKTNRVRELSLDPEVEWVEEDQRYQVEQAPKEPNDPMLGNQWSLVKAQINEAWKLVPANAKPVLVAVVDTGIDLQHPDLKNQIFTNDNEIANNSVDDDENGYIDDIHGWNFEAKDNDTQDDFQHGSHVSGIIGATQNNQIGVAGIAPAVKILPVRWMKVGSGWGADAIEGIQYAVKMGARVINASWGGIGYSKALEEAVREAESQGVLFVASAGNNHSDNDVKPRHPANLRFSNVIAVASTNEKDELDSTSNFGKKQVELAAPGANVVSTFMNGQYGSLSGTSMAAAEVSGIAALLLAINPRLRGQDLKKILIQSVDLIPSLKDKTITGGRVNALKAAQLALHSLQSDKITADDRDLSGTQKVKPKTFTGNLIKPDRTEDGASVSGLAVQIVRLVGGVETPVEGLSFKTQIHGDNQYQNFVTDQNGWVKDSVCKKPSITTTITFDSKLFRLTPGTATYEMILNAKCGVQQKVVFEEKTDAGQVIGIWQMAKKGQNKLQNEVGSNFWKRQITFLWPGNGDYYGGDQVNLTMGYAWDVVSHEMGHAIYDQGGIGVFGGGQHYIDQCYSEALALSEGWASMYAAWLNIDLGSVDAHFEYMVPRRAPIRFENIPADVCGKSTNEWRVIGFLWDLIDTHDDGETLEKPFSLLWKDTLGTRASSISVLKANLIKKGWDSATLDTIWKLNFPAE